jgi:1-phosphatidylinositol phosphodiesterase
MLGRSDFIMKRKAIMLFLTLAICLGAQVLMISSTFALAGQVDTVNWMSEIDGNKMLSELTIPGTHDTCALYEPLSSLAKCQNMVLNEQLNAGVRYIDIRCRHINNKFAIHHGMVYQNINFDNVRNICVQFLNAHPTETIIMHVKEEYNPTGNTRTFEQTFDSYLRGYESIFYLGDTIPKLGDARGKIVLLRRFAISTTPRGIDATGWKDNATFIKDLASGSKLCIQDEYKKPRETKWNAIKSLLERSISSGQSNTLYINYTSGTGSNIIPNIRSISDYVNPRVNNYLTGRSGRFGIIAMDFIDIDLSKLIINSNLVSVYSKMLM